MRVAINEKIINEEFIAVRELGFGEPIDTKNRQNHHYSLYISFFELTSVFKEQYDTFVQEIQEDDLQYGDICEDIEATGYVGYLELLRKDKNALLSIIKEYLLFELLQSLFSGSSPKKYKYAISTVKTIEISDDNDGVVILGDAYSL